MLKNNNNNKTLNIIGILLITFGISLLSYNYINTKINYAYDYMNIKLMDNEMPREVNEEDEVLNNEVQNDQIENDTTSNSTDNNSTNNNKNKYIGTLEIPRISLKRGFVSKDSSANNVNKNIAIMSASDYPDKSNGNFILAAHSGNSSIAYFKNLYELERNDLAYVYYNNVKYTYQITNIYTQPKVGKIKIYRNKSIKCLTLITCTKNDSTTQTVYIAELIKEEIV